MSGKHQLLKKIVPKEMVETLNQIRADWDRKKAVKERKNAIKERKMQTMRVKRFEGDGNPA